MIKSRTKICLGIVIPTYNRSTYLRILLLQLLSQTNVENIEMIPVVVDDGSTDGTYEMLISEFPTVKVVKGSGQWWWTKCLNEGIKYLITHFKPYYFLILNDDSQVEPNYINLLLMASERAGEKNIVGSISVTLEKPYRVSFSGVKKISKYTFIKKPYYKSYELLMNIPQSGLLPTYALNGRGTLIRSAIIKELGGFNERVFPQYGSDDDIALRAWSKGYKVLLALDCKVFDRTMDTSKGTAFRQDSPWVFLKSFFTRNSVNYIPKQLSFFYFHGIKLLVPLYILIFFLGTTYAYLFKYRSIKYEL